MNANASSYTESDRKLGYVLLCILLAFCIGIGVAAAYIIQHPRHERILSFSQIGNLKQDDPVYIRGVRAGTICAIEWQPLQVLVHVTETQPFELHAGYHIDNIDIGTMGDRIIMITDGSTLSPVIDADDTLYGTFHPGISEVIGQIQKLCAAVDSLCAVSSRMRNGSRKHASFITATKTIVCTTDSVSRSVSIALARIATTIPPALDSLTSMLDSAAKTSRRAATAMPSILFGADTGLVKLGSTLDYITALSDNVASLTSALEKHPLFAARTSDSLQVQQQLAQITTIVRQAQDRLLQIKINLHLW
jgi:hypothetical protein